MKAEPIGERKFISELQERGSIWIAWQEGSALVVPVSEGGNAVYAWSDREKADAYISVVKPACRPVEVPLQTFRDVWLQDTAMNIQEVRANPHTQLPEVLTFNRSEILESLDGI
jgi:hypothetical protein